MKLQITTSLLILSMVILSCGQSNDKANATSADTNQVATMDTTTEKNYAVSLV
ncbi:MAG: hypothetical protein RLZZ614_1569, partial [Bacteroidota bacterium]